MSDDEDFMMSDEDSYEFEFEDDDDEMEEEESETKNYDLENRYYEAKALREEGVGVAISKFEEITGSEADDANVAWVFKSYKQLMKLYFRELKQYPRVMELYGRLLDIAPRVNKQYSEDSLNKIITNYSSCEDGGFTTQLLNSTLEYLSERGNSNVRLWLKININRLNILLEDVLKNKEGGYDEVFELINQVNEKLETVSETTRATYSLEVIAIEIQLYSIMNNTRKLKQLYKKTLSINSAVPHPRIMGIIREAGGKMFFNSQRYPKARIEFYESFKNYDEAGSPYKNVILKYLILCSVLTETEVNPFEAQETQTYAKKDEFKSLVDMIKYYDANDLERFNLVVDQMNSEGDKFYDDVIFQNSIEKIRDNLRRNILISILKSYKRVKFSYLEKKVLLSQVDIEAMIVKLVSHGQVVNIKMDLGCGYVEVVHPEESKITYNITSGQILANMRVFEDGGSSIEIVPSAPKVDNDGDQVMGTPLARNVVPSPSGGAAASIPVPVTTKPTTLMGLMGDMRRKSNSDQVEISSQVALWHKYLLSAEPIKAKNELSQKDQVELEQRTNIKVDKLDDDEEKDVEDTKYQALRSLYQEIQGYYDNFISK